MEVCYRFREEGDLAMEIHRMQKPEKRSEGGKNDRGGRIERKDTARRR